MLSFSKAIRDLCILGSDSFLSASNDGDVKIWKLQMPDVSADVVRTISAHDHFIYTMTPLRGEQEDAFAVGGENSGVKIFRGGQVP